MYGVLMTPNVIDIYHGNVVNDFAALKAAGVLGVIHKCTQGANYADPLYATRRKQANDAGLMWGAYSFNTGETVSHANQPVYRPCRARDQYTLMALDFEDNPHSQMSLDQARQFLELADAQLGRSLVIYSGNRVKDLLGNTNDSFFGSHRLWLAQYGPVARVQASWGKQWLWQYSESGRLPGTDGQIDLNTYDGTAEQLQLDWAGQTETT